MWNPFNYKDKRIERKNIEEFNEEVKKELKKLKFSDAIHSNLIKNDYEIKQYLDQFFPYEKEYCNFIYEKQYVYRADIYYIQIEMHPYRNKHFNCKLFFSEVNNSKIIYNKDIYKLDEEKFTELISFLKEFCNHHQELSIEKFIKSQKENYLTFNLINTSSYCQT